LKTLTFDWNCVISAEQGDDKAFFVNSLVALHRREEIEVAITTVSASETLKGSKEFPSSAASFTNRLAELGWNDLPLIRGPSVIGLTYIDMCTIVGLDFESETDAIWNVIGGDMPRELPTPLSDEELWSPTYKNWRNVWCDVHTLWTHIVSGRDVFITTNTKDFQRKAKMLSELGLREVKTPEEMIGDLIA
jgi:hypothetical protein